MKFWALSASALLTILVSGKSWAQEITGQVTSRSAPVSGAVVAMLDSAGVTLLRALTSMDGRYRLSMRPAARQLRVTRIGFRPQMILLTPDAGSRTIDVELERLPVLLTAVRVVDQPGCPRRRDRAEAFALWEQVSAALLSTVVARESESTSIQRLLFYRIAGENRPGVLSQVVSIDTGGTRPFGAARTAQEFVAFGFHDDATGTWFAPDADVLLDDWFVRGYCIKLADADRGRRGQLGLSFAPAARKRGRVDIEGTLWVDTSANALTDLEFRYVGLSAARMALRLGGQVHFTAMPGGFPAITRWSMRIDAPSARPVSRFDRGPRNALEAHELGGELARARWADMSWTATLGRVSGRLLADTVPVPETWVQLVGTPYRARTDSAGRYSIDGLLPGRYTFSVQHRDLNALGFELTLAQSFVSDRDNQHVDVALPTEHAFVGAICNRGPSDTTTQLVAGRVYDAAGELVPDSWVELFEGKPTQIGGGAVSKGSLADTLAMTWERKLHRQTGTRTMFFGAAEGSIGGTAAFYLCVRPEYAMLRLDVREGTRHAHAHVLIARGKRIHVVPLYLAPKP